MRSYHLDSGGGNELLITLKVIIAVCISKQRYTYEYDNSVPRVLSYAYRLSYTQTEDEDS